MSSGNTTVQTVNKSNNYANQKIDLDKPRFDQATFWGRVRHFFDVIDPRMIFVSNSRVEEAAQLVSDYKKGKISTDDVSEDQLWQAKKVTNSVLHPDTGEKIPLPFRMSFQTPANTLIVTGMLGAHSVGSICAWQIVNQTFNVCVNYANRNASSSMTTNQIFGAYIGAVATSVATATTLKSIVVKRNMNSGFASRLIPFTAVALAHFFNVGTMRGNEIIDGISLKKPDGTPLPEEYKSRKAGSYAVGTTILSRVSHVVPTMVFPPSVMYLLESRTQLFNRFPRLKLPVNAGLVATAIFSALPFCIGMFPQQSSISISDLEPKFRSLDLKNNDGSEVTHLIYNKGL
eukprot:gb/GECH01009756.1/.p1 GENE.gb/GECH01009756.1/~~gb/GECH01009756.1/.p1  ORF type:complete len:345 (+),score=49.15 gb/GECH01009756.1/:1-1035(+)